MFDIKTILAAIIASFKTSLKGIAVENIPQIISAITEYTSSAAVRLTDLASNYAKGEANDGISKEFLLERLKDEKDILKSQLLSLETLGEVIAQAIVDSFEDLLLGAIIQEEIKA